MNGPIEFYGGLKSPAVRQSGIHVFSSEPRMGHASCRPLEQTTSLNVLSGLVLLGVLITQTFAFPPLGHLFPLGSHRAELPGHFLMQLLVSGQFERMGSFLLGVGLYRGWRQARLEGPGLEGPSREGMDAGRLIRRGLTGLLGLGLGLSLLRGAVDLLLVYALLGFTLLYFVNQSVRSLLSWLVVLALVAIGVPGSVRLLYPDGMTTPSLVGWPVLSEWLFSDRSVSQGFGPTVSYEVLLLAGLLVGKLGMSQQDARLRVHLSLLQVVILPVAFGLKGAWVVLALSLVVLPQELVVYQPELLALSGFFGPLLLTGVYLLDMWVNIRSTPSGWTRWLGRVGQLSVTNYSLQSLLCPLFLHGYEVALSGPPTVWGRVALVVVIVALQIGFSWLWGKHHRQGPLEWICCQWMVANGGSRFP